MGEFDTTLGAISLGTNINFFLFGLVAYQFAHYYNSDYNDSLTIRALVLWMLLLDTFHTAICGYTLWDYTITHFNEPAYVTNVDWIYNFTPTITGLTSCPVQLFLAWRVYLLTKSRWLYAIIAVTAVSQALAAVGTTIGAFILNDVFRFPDLRPIVGTWFSLQMVCDCFITSCLVYTLHKNKTGYRKTDHVVNRLMRASVETAAFATLFCALDMTMFFAFPGTHLHIIFAFPMGRIYSNSMLGTLNARASHRDVLDATISQPPTWNPSFFHLSRVSNTVIDSSGTKTVPRPISLNVRRTGDTMTVGDVDMDDTKLAALPSLDTEPSSEGHRQEDRKSPILVSDADAGIDHQLHEIDMERQ